MAVFNWIGIVIAVQGNIYFVLDYELLYNCFYELFKEIHYGSLIRTCINLAPNIYNILQALSSKPCSAFICLFVFLFQLEKVL